MAGYNRPPGTFIAKAVFVDEPPVEGGRFMRESKANIGWVKAAVARCSSAENVRHLIDGRHDRYAITSFDQSTKNASLTRYVRHQSL